MCVVCVLLFLLSRATTISRTFVNTLVMTTVPDLVKLPLEALRLRVIIGA